MGLKKIIMGEPMPNKNDPKYKERYEREVEAGKQERFELAGHEDTDGGQPPSCRFPRYRLRHRDRLFCH